MQCQLFQCDEQRAGGGGGGGLTADAFAAEDQRGWMSVCAVPGQNPHMFKRSLIEN